MQDPAPEKGRRSRWDDWEVWHLPFAIVLMAQLMSLVTAWQQFEIWWPDPAWVPRPDCVLIDDSTQTHELGRTGSLTYRCPADELKSVFYPGLFSLVAVLFVAAPGRTRIAAMLATLISLLTLLVSGSLLTSSEVRVTVTYPVFGQPSANIGGYSALAAIILMLLTLVVWGLFWAAISQNSPQPARRTRQS